MEGNGDEIEQPRDSVPRILSRMKKKELTTKQQYSVPCHTCGAGIGARCVLYSGVARTDSHVGRKLSALEATERKHR
jgi:hypothetical protein